MAEEWDDGTELPPSVDEGRTFGKGRGYNNNRKEINTIGSQRGHYEGSNGGSGFVNDNSNGDDNDCGDASWDNNDGGGWGSGGWGSSNGRSNGRDDNGGERRGRGQGGGRGGSRYRNDDDRRNNGHGGRGGGRYNDRNGDDYENEDNNDYRGGGGGGGRYNDRNGDDDYQARGRSGDQGGCRGGGRDRGRDRSDRDDCENAGNNVWENCNDGNNGWGDGDSGNNSWGDSGGRNNGYGDRGGGKKGWGGHRGEGGGDEDSPNGDRPPPVTYIPPEISTEDNEIFGGVNVGLNFAKYDDIEVTVSGENAPQPTEEFKAMGLRSLILKNIVKSGYTKPTPVQKYAIPIIMAGRDLMACAQTGSGKTAAFMVPIINTLLERPSELKLIGGGCEPHCVVVSPTHELTEQIWRQALKFSKDSVIKCTVIYGGVSCMYQGKQVANGCHILVATPGRLLDFVERRRVSFASIRYVVLDEADRMLDMGFLDSMQKMMNHETMVPKEERQTLMFSATFGEEVQHIACDFLNDYLFLTVGIVGGACADVEQIFHEVSRSEKRRKLMELLQHEDPIPRTMIFVEMKKTADIIAILLSDKRIPATSIHGDRTQQQREEALRDFRSGRMPVLVATSVAARGLDIEDVAHVINYDLPKEVDEYVHRIGRTGRLGNRGRATSLFNPEADGAIASGLVRILNQAEQKVPYWLSAIGGGEGGGRFASGRGDRDIRNFDNHDSYDDPSSYSNDAYNEPEQEW